MKKTWSQPQIPYSRTSNKFAPNHAQPSGSREVCSRWPTPFEHVNGGCPAPFFAAFAKGAYRAPARMLPKTEPRNIVRGREDLNPDPLVPKQIPSVGVAVTDGRAAWEIPQIAVDEPIVLDATTIEAWKRTSERSESASPIRVQRSFLWVALRSFRWHPSPASTSKY